MTEFSQYLESVRIRLGIKNNRQLSFALKVSHVYIADMIHGHKIPGDEMCKKIAELAGDDVEKVILLAHKSKASEAMRPIWEGLLKKVANVAMISGVVMLPFLLKSIKTVYIMLNQIIIFAKGSPRRPATV